MWRFLILAALTTGLTFFLNNSWNVGGKPLPPLGKFMSPSHGFWQNAEKANFFDNTIRLRGTQSEIQVVFDQRMVPHIFAQNERDLYYAQGYLTAMHRLWQMDITSRSGSGRISEIMGDGALNYDKSQRRKGLVWAAERTLEVWESNPEAMMPVEAYTEGINDYLDKLKPRQYPVEFKLLDYSPEEWTHLKSALFVKSMATTLCSREYDLEFTTLLDKLGPELFDFYYPEYNPDQDPIIPVETPWDFVPLTAPVVQGTDVPEVRSNILNTDPLNETHVGSNNWAVNGSKTASGKPILCNDPHLKLSLPSIWYEVHMVAPDRNTHGVSFPGIPFIIIGFNEDAAWGPTNVGHDVLDWYQIKWTNENHSQYELDGTIEDVTYRVEEIATKSGKIIVDSVPYTVWGPVMDSGPYKGLAMRWLAHEKPANTDITAFRKLNTVSNPEEFMEALDSYHTPAQNFVFADRDNNIALRIGGVLPLRVEGQGRFVSDGSNSANGWSRTIPPRHNPMVINPERGFVSSANQRTTNDSYPYYYTGGKYFEDYRGRTLNRYLNALQEADKQDMQQLQQSSFSLKAEQILPEMLRMVDSTTLSMKEQEMVTALESWDYFYDHTKLEPAYFEIWFEQIMRSTFDEIEQLSDSLYITFPESWRLIELATSSPDTFAFDISATPEVETFKDIALLSLKAAAEEVEQFDEQTTWGQYRTTSINHLGNIPAFGVRLNNASGHGSALNAVSSQNGPSWRMIVELTDPVQARVVYPGGQSGNPGSKYYDNMIDDWVQGNYHSVGLEKTPSEVDKLYTLTIQTKGK